MGYHIPPPQPEQLSSQKLLKFEQSSFLVGGLLSNGMYTVLVDVVMSHLVSDKKRLAGIRKLLCWETNLISNVLSK